jgi:hypothetical protein
MDHEVALAHAITRIKEGLPADRVIAELVGMEASPETARDVVDRVLAMDPVAPRPRQAKRALAVVEVPPDAQRFSDALMRLQPFWLRAGASIAAIAFGIAVGLAVAPMWAKPREPSAPPLSGSEARWAMRLFVISCAVPGALAYVGLYVLHSLALTREVNEWYSHAYRRGAARVELYKDRLVLRGGDVPWSAVSDAAEVESKGIHLLAVRARHAWEILPADAFKEGDFAGARSLMSKKLGRKVRIRMLR